MAPKKSPKTHSKKGLCSVLLANESESANVKHVSSIPDSLQHFADCRRCLFFWWMHIERAQNTFMGFKLEESIFYSANIFPFFFVGFKAKVARFHLQPVKGATSLTRQHSSLNCFEPTLLCVYNINMYLCISYILMEGFSFGGA